MSSTENTHLKNITTAGDLKPSSFKISIVQGNNYQRPGLIVAGSLLTLLLWIAVASKSSGDHQVKLSAYEMANGAGALTDYQGETTNSVLVKDIFGMGPISKNEDASTCCRRGSCNSRCGFCIGICRCGLCYDLNCIGFTCSDNGEHC